MKQFGRVLALSAVPFALGGMFKKAYGRTPADVLAVLNFALTLEYLEAAFYAEAITHTSLFPTEAALQAFTTIGNHETAHVAFLKTAITGASGTPVDKPTFDFTAGGTFSDVFTNYGTLLKVAQAFEDTGVRAYKGQAAVLMENSTVLTAALQIHSVEARHAAHIRSMRRATTGNTKIKPWITGKYTDVPETQPVYNGEENEVQADITVTGIATQVTQDAATESFDEPLSKADVLDIAHLFIVP
jgi:rubrerythrin